MLKMKTERRRVKIAEHYIEFNLDDNSGYCFPCDASGSLLPMEECAMENYRMCMDHPEKFRDWNKFATYYRSYTENATGVCVCGETVELWDQYMGACECPRCGRWYNLFGQELLPPEMWEE